MHLRPEPPSSLVGLKPVHRRILFAMHELGLSSSKPFRKCARVVGEVLGKYHPHGDTAVYDALVRLAQDFSMRCATHLGAMAVGKGEGGGAKGWRCRGEAGGIRLEMATEPAPRARSRSPAELSATAAACTHRAPLVDGHGNFGSLDNDPPAAMRYTECRLHRLAMASLLTDLDCDTVEFAPNFDGSQVRQPSASSPPPPVIHSYPFSPAPLPKPY